MPALSLKSLERRVSALEKRAPALTIVPPAKLAKGDVDVGLTIHAGKVARLILLAERYESGTWDEAKAWAKKLGAELPSRVDALLLWERHKDLGLKFETDRPYWTSEQYAGDSSYAWNQWFYHGLQYHWHKDTKTRACAVRRVFI